MFNIFSSKKTIEYLIVGLGNPGISYKNTRHNVGFWVIDRIAEERGASVNKLKNKALTGEASVGGHRVLLVKPQTFMNLSGEAVRDIAHFYKIPSDKLIIIMDDISLPPGKLRIRTKGSDGGHNGLKSVAMHMGDDYLRVKIGVGQKPHPDYDLAKWVLSNFKQDEQKLVNAAVAEAVKAIELMTDGKTAEAMNKFN